MKILTASLGILVLLAFLLANNVQGGTPSTSTPVPTPASMSDPTAWITPPANGPTQADHGAYVYGYRCMVCHGDQGQGLALFRASYPKQDQNCSPHKCHAGPGSLAGFSFPDAPTIIGAGTLGRFQTAHDLYIFIRAQMPYHAPGILSSDDYWALTAFLLRQHQVLPDGTQVDMTNADAVLIHPITAQPFNPLWLGGALLASFALGGYLIWRRYRPRRPNSR